MEMGSCESICICACTCFTMRIDGCVHVWACMWRPCVNLGCHSSTTSHFEFCDRATHWPAIPVGLGCRCLKTKCTDAWFSLSEVANDQPEHFFFLVCDIICAQICLCTCAHVEAGCQCWVTFPIAHPIFS